MILLSTDNGTVGVGAGQEPGGAPPAEQLGITWVGGDGAAWDLCGGPVWLLSGARGFGMPPPVHWTQTLGLLDGASWTGMRIGARDVYLPVEVDTRLTGQMLTTDRSWAAGLDPRTEGVLRVTTPDARSRELRCRYVEGAEGEYDTDPVLLGGATYGLRLVANDPYWRGEPVTARFAYPDAAPSFFTGPPFRLAPSEVLGASTVTNAGDVAATAVWRVDGPFTGFTVGIGDALVTMPLVKPAGGWVEIDMDPSRLTLLDENGTDLWPVADEVVFTPIPPGETTLSTMLTGAAPGSAVQVSFTPRFLRAW